MYAQLGTTRFDGAKSFVSFSGDEEAIIVEHALINRPAKLQATAIGLRNISLTLFLHQEFCNVAQEVASLRNSKNNFDILPLLWGNGKAEGDFVITSITETKVLQDSIGNTIATNISLSLKECVDEDKLNQKQLDAQKNAFAVGDKTPPTKSNRVNPTPCNKRISSMLSTLKSGCGKVDALCKGYTNTPGSNSRLYALLNQMHGVSTKLIAESLSPDSCANKVSGMGIAAKDVRDKIDVLLNDVSVNVKQYPNLIFPPNMIYLKGQHNTDLQAAVRTLYTVANPLIKSSITNK